MPNAVSSQPGILIPPDMLTLMVKGVSVIVSACGLDLRPSVMRAMGSVVAPDGALVTLYLSRSQSGQLLRDIASTGRVAVVFTQPHSHRAMQVKGEKARIRAVGGADQPALERYVVSMERELALIGYPVAFTRAMFAYQLDDLEAVCFAPIEVFDQTPGPKAGSRVGSVLGAMP